MNAPIPSMLYEKRSACADCWTPIEVGQLQQEISAKDIDRMFTERNILVGQTKYRRAIPENVKDWVKHDYGVKA